MMRPLPLLLSLAALSCGSSGASDVTDASGESHGDALVTFDAADTADAGPDAPPAQLCRERFHAEIPSFGPVRAPVVGPDGTLYVASGDLVLTLGPEGLECATCWRHTVQPEPGTGVVLAHPALLGDGLVVGTSQGLLVKLSLSDGEERWRFPSLQEAVTTAPVAFSDGLLVAGRDTLFFLAEGSPGQVFVTSFEPLEASPRQPVVSGDTALIAAGHRVLRRAADGSGDALMVFEPGQGALTSAVTPLGDGRFVLGAEWADGDGEHRGLVVVDPATGQISPVETAGLLAGPSMLVVTPGGRVLGVTDVGEGLVADLAAGTSARFALGGLDVGHPLLGDDGVWYLAVVRGESGVELVAREAGGVAGGQVLWSATVDGNQASPVALTAGGTVLFPAGRVLHGYRCGTSALADAPWVKFQNDHGNTGRLP